MDMAVQSGCMFEKLTARNVKIQPVEKEADVVRTTIRVHANEKQNLVNFAALLSERSDRVFVYEAEGSKVYVYEAFQRQIKAMMRSGTLSLIIFL